MSSAVAELEAGLQALLGLKPPGVSGSRIANLTALCVANVQSESVLIQKLYTHFKKTPGTHKLGVLYVVDSVTRKWMDQAKAQGQPINRTAQDGTPAAGVHRVTELMPMLMNDIMATAPEDQKEKIRKLIDIWEKGQTFPPALISTFKAKLSAPRPNESTTPPGSPPPNLMAFLGVGGAGKAGQPQAQQHQQQQQPPAMPSIMETLANIARQNATAAQSNPSMVAPAPVSAPPPLALAYGAPVGSHSNGAAQHPPQGMPYYPASSQPGVPPVNFQGLPLAFQPPAQPAAASALPLPPTQAPAPGGVSNQPNAFPANNPTVQLVAALAAQGLPFEKIASVIQLMGQGAAAAPQAPQVPQMPQPTQTGYAAPPPPPAAHAPGPAPWEMSRPDEARDRNGYHDSMRSPGGRPRGRSRSRSPRGWDARESPRSRNDRGFEYGRPPSPGRGRPDDRDRNRMVAGHTARMPDYRQRSPPRRGPPSPEPEPSQQEKWVEYDNSIPNGSIKVYSRTLFVGGVTCPEAELRQIFSRFGQVQTCIVNKDKRHAFVKMYFRKDAEAAKAAMEDPRNPDLQLRTRWGVGFGPRDCSDYQSGISIIPIHKLTEADRKWMLTAPFGGSGGRPIVTGLSVEEPDIEIGAGVSSKAISRRMQTDKGGNHGPKSSRRDDDAVNGIPVANDRGGRRWHGREKRNNGAGDHRREDSKGGSNDEPVVLGLPAGITMGPNGINYPPNFAF
ncbi:hypothetical protein B0T16DRAFT_242071 [Cercophora newfieldiana]|uniref:Uncharacterized protein n=1 Tax=Cercophora newfieldiana TaxID=92897 RepID=A0AA39XT54_9PEZI|nr:hypothetical protein B0T16DRAFT_242071 [Cercophora newfieldiana]